MTDTQVMENGFYQGAHAAVLDLGAYVRDPAVEHAKPPRFAASQADVHGAALLTSGMARAEEAEFEANLEDYGVELDVQTLGILASSVESFEFVASTAISSIAAKATAR